MPVHLTLGDLRRYVQHSGTGLLQPLDGDPDWDAPLGPAVNDSRAVTPGALFVALPGERTDGHHFALDARARGAVALILAHVPEGDFVTPDRPGPPAVAWLVPDPLAALQGFAAWWRDQFPQLRVAGITGSVGKTTAKEVISSALSAVMPVLASPRSFNNEIGLPLTLLSLTGVHRAAVLEMGIYNIGDIALLAGIARQTIGVVLNVDAVHLERAGSIERIAQAKAEMITTLPPEGIAILNRDDARVYAMRALAPGPVRTFGLEPGADWQGADVQVLADGLLLTLVHAGNRYPLRSALLGRHHAYALLAAAAVLDAVGLPAEQIPQVLAAVPASAARQRIVRGPGNRLIIDDTYNASPLSMRAALDLLSAQPGTRHVAILADMLELGPISQESHQSLGAYASERSDLVLAVGPLARDIAQGHSNARWFPDKASLRAQLDTLLKEGDVVLVKGSRGMAMEDVVAWLIAGEREG